MQEFLEFTLGGIGIGMIYAAIALSLVLIWRGTRVLNYSQGGMAMFTTYVAWLVINHSGNYWLGFVVALASGLVLGAVLERVVVRPTLGKAPLNAVIVTIGLLIFLEGLAGIIYGGQFRSFPRGLLDHRVEVGTVALGISPERPVHRRGRAPRGAGAGRGLPVHGGGPAAARHRVQPGCGPAARGADRAGADPRLGAGRPVRRAGRACWSRRPRSCTRTAWTRSSCSASPPPSSAAWTARVGAVVGGVVLGVVLSYVGGYLGSDLVLVYGLVVLVAVLMIRPSGLFSGAPPPGRCDA